MACRLNKRAKTKGATERQRLYDLKYRLWSEVITHSPADVFVDSLLKRMPLTLGITHRPTGYRCHIEVYRMPGEAQIILNELADASGIHYPMFRLDQSRTVTCIRRPHDHQIRKRTHPTKTLT